MTAWRKSSYSGTHNECVEVAVSPAGAGIRDSKDPEGPVLVFDSVLWREFVLGVKDDEFVLGVQADEPSLFSSSI